MEVHPIVVALALLFVVGAVGGIRHHVQLRRALRGECAARRLTAAAHHRDAEALARRIQSVVWERAVLDEADLVLDTALAVHHRDEGGPV